MKRAKSFFGSSERNLKKICRSRLQALRKGERFEYKMCSACVGRNVTTSGETMPGGNFMMLMQT